MDEPRIGLLETSDGQPGAARRHCRGRPGTDPYVVLAGGAASRTRSKPRAAGVVRLHGHGRRARPADGAASAFAGIRSGEAPAPGRPAPWARRPGPGMWDRRCAPTRSGACSPRRGGGIPDRRSAPGGCVSSPPATGCAIGWSIWTEPSTQRLIRELEAVHSRLRSAARRRTCGRGCSTPSPRAGRPSGRRGSRTVASSPLVQRCRPRGSGPCDGTGEGRRCLTARSSASCCATSCAVHRRT